MASRPRIRLPETFRTGDVIEVKTLISHVMETGARRDRDGRPVARDIIHTLTATFNGTQVFKGALQPGIAANPYVAFFFKVPGAGELQLVWTEDSGQSVTEKVKIEPKD